MAENPLLTMLADNVAKWKDIVAAIEKEKTELKPGEDTAFYELCEHCMYGHFDPVKCANLLDTMAQFKARHPKGKFLENLQEFRALCKSYYTKDKATFEAFQKAMGPVPKPVLLPVSTPELTSVPEPEPEPPKPALTSTPAHPLLTMLTENVAKWASIVAAIVREDSEKKEFKPREETAFYELCEHCMYGHFDPVKCANLLDTMAQFKAMHPKGKFLENLQEFRALCKNYCTKDKAIFEAFQKAVPKVPKPAPKPVPTPTVTPQPVPPKPPTPTVTPTPNGADPSSNYLWSISSLIVPIAIVSGWIPITHLPVWGGALFIVLAAVFILPVWAIVCSAKVKKAPGLSSALSRAKRARLLSLTTMVLAVALFFIGRDASAALPEAAIQTTEEKADLKSTEDGTKATPAANNTKPKAEPQNVEQPKATVKSSASAEEGAANLRKAAAAFKEGAYADAAKFYRACKDDLGKDLTTEIARADECNTLLIQAAAFWDVNDYANASQKYKALLALNPDDPTAQSRLKEIDTKESAVAVQQTAPASNTAVINPKPETPPPPRVSIGSMTTPSRQIEMKATTAELLDNGKTFRMDFVLINHGGNIDKHSLRGSSYNESKAYDNDGNLCYITLAVGGGSYYGDYENAPLPSNVPVKVSIKITRFGSSATSFPLITLVGCGPNSVAGCDPYIYEFKDVVFK